MPTGDVWPWQWVKWQRPLMLAKVDLFIGDVCLMRGGIKNPAYQEDDGARVMAAEEILLHSQSKCRRLLRDRLDQ